MKTGIATLMILLGLLAGCGTFGAKEDEPAMGPDAVLEAKVKTALISAPDVDGAAIGIRVQGDAVTLTGFTENRAERDRAEAIALGVEGVARVINRIELPDAER